MRLALGFVDAPLDAEDVRIETVLTHFLEQELDVAELGGFWARLERKQFPQKVEHVPPVHGPCTSYVY